MKDTRKTEGRREGEEREREKYKETDNWTQINIQTDREVERKKSESLHTC